MKIFRTTRCVAILAAMTALAGCSNPTPTPSTSAQTPVATAQQPAAQPAATQAQAGANPAATQTPKTATPAQAGLPSGIAARVNGVDITKTQLDREVQRYIASDPDAPQLDSADGVDMVNGVLESLIEQTLIDQEAAKQGIVISDKDINDDIAALTQMRGGQPQLKEWMQMVGMTDQDLREMARQELTVMALQEKMTTSVPATAEYVHAYHILVNTEAEAKQILAQLQGGAKFDTLAKTKSVDASTAPNGGDLDWFTKGTGAIVWEEVENAAFALKPGQLSGVVKSPVGFHIVKTVARETRPLTAEDAAFLQQASFENWLQTKKDTAKIERAK